MLMSSFISFILCIIKDAILTIITWPTNYGHPNSINTFHGPFSLPQVSRDQNFLSLLLLSEHSQEQSQISWPMKNKNKQKITILYILY